MNGKRPRLTLRRNPPLRGSRGICNLITSNWGLGIGYWVLGIEKSLFFISFPVPSPQSLVPSPPTTDMATGNLCEF